MNKKSILFLLLLYMFYVSAHRKIWYAPNRFEAYGEEEIKAVEDCLRDGWLAGL